MASMGEMIRGIRRKRGLSQEELAQAIGSTKSAISRYESGKRQPDYDQLQRIAVTLDVEWLELVPTDKQGQIVIDHVIGKLREVQGQPVDEAISELALRAGEAEGRYRGLMAGLKPEVFDINKSLIRLNLDGRKEAVKRVEELTEIPRYRRKEAPPEVSSSTDTTPPTDAPEMPPEGE